MRYILVNRPERPKELCYCTFCTTAIGKTYVRDLDTKLVYHSHFCLEMHIHDSQVAIGGYDAAVAR